MNTTQLRRSTTKLCLTICTILALVVVPNTPAISQSSGGESESGGGEMEVTATATGGLTNARTAAITLKISATIDECRLIPEEYRADCLAQNLREASKIVKNNGYRKLNAEISSAAQQISSIVAQNIDTSAPKLRLGKKTYRAVKKSALSAVNKKAAAVVAETSTVLLRSTGSSALKKVHFTRIAKAVNSTKVLLRSA